MFLSSTMPAFQPVSPAGSWIYESQKSDSLIPADAHTVTFNATAGQQISVLAQPVNGSLALGLSLIGPDATTVASAVASGTNAPVSTQLTIAPATGVYTIQVSDDATAGDGDFVLTAFLNAGVAGPIAGDSNFTPATAKNIDNAFVNLGGNASRAAVIGSPYVVPGGVPDFSNYQFGPEWSTYTNGGGSIELQGSAFVGGSPVLSFLARGDAPAVQEAIWTVNLAGVPNPSLNFDSDLINVVTPFTGDFVGHANAKGVAISDDGIHWHPVVSIHSVEDGHYSVNLRDAAAAAGMSLGNGFKIKFQTHFDATVPTADTLWFKNIEITAPAQTWYSVTLAAGDVVSLKAAATQQLSGSDGHFPTIDLFDPAGTERATGVSLGLSEQGLSDFTADHSGTWFVRVDAAGLQQFSLVVAKNAEFTQGSHSSFQPAQDLSATGKVLGSASNAMGRMFGAYANAARTYDVREIDPSTANIIRSFTTSIPVDAAGVGMATSSTSIWLAAGSRLYEINPDSGSVLRSFNVIGHWTSAAYCQGKIYLYSEQYPNFAVIDAQTGQALPIPNMAGGSFGGAMTGIGDRLLSAGTVYGKGYSVTEFVPATGLVQQLAVIAPTPEVDFSSIREPLSLASFGNRLYIRVENHDEFMVVDMNDWRQIGSLPAHGSAGDSGGDGGVTGNWYYSVPAHAGDVLTFTTSTPGGPENTLDPALALYSPDGTLASTDANSAADARNAKITFSALTDGTYTIRLTAASGSGDFTLAASGYTGAPAGLAVVATDPTEGQLLTTVPTFISFQFSSPIDPTTIAASDLTIDGRPATAYTLVDSSTVSFTIPALGNGIHQYQLSSGAMNSATGIPLIAYAGNFDLEVAAPRVFSSSIAEGDTFSAGNLRVSFTFDRPLADVQADDFELDGLTAPTADPASWNYDASTQTLTINYASLPASRYWLTLFSGGTHIAGANGAALDGEAQATAALPSGNGSPGGNYVLDFAVLQPNAVAAPTTLAAFGVSSTEIDLSWTDHSTGLAAYGIERSTAGGPFIEVGQAVAGLTSYSDTSCQPLQTYTYRVRGYIGAGVSPYTLAISGTTLPPELYTPITRLPAAPELLSQADDIPSIVYPVGHIGFFSHYIHESNHADLELWRTDGTTAGTLKLHTFRDVAYPVLSNGNGKLYFNITNSDGTTLWESDGTISGTAPSAPGTIAPDPIARTKINPFQDTVGGVTFAPNGFGMVCTVNGVATTVAPGHAQMTIVGVVGSNIVFMRAPLDDSNVPQAQEVWTTDGTTDGTRRLLVQPFGEFSIMNSVAVGSEFYFTDDSGIWKSDLTAAGTSRITPISGEITDLEPLDSSFTFEVNNQIWSSNGTAAGTRQLTQIGLQEATTHPDYLTMVNGTVYFSSSARNSPFVAAPSELWKSDGTAAGTVQVAPNSASQLINLNGKLFFIGEDPYNGKQLWTSDGTPAGTHILTSIPNFFRSSHPTVMAVANGRLFFSDGDGALWETNGTSAGTMRVPGAPVVGTSLGLYDNGTQYAVAGNYLYFGEYSGNDLATKALWRTDGTAAGTNKIAGIGAYWEMAAVGSTLYVAGWKSLYKVAAGTTSVQVLASFGHNFNGFFETGTYPDLTKVGNNLFFVAPGSGSAENTWLWKSDGTTAGTVAVARISVGASNQPFINHITDVNGRAFFLATSATYSMTNQQLWVSNGTSSGTFMVRPVTNATGTLYTLAADGLFVFSDGEHLWRSDGTATGTVQIDDVATASDGSSAANNFYSGAPAVASGDQLYYGAAAPGGGTELRIASLTPPPAPSAFALTEGAAALSPQSRAMSVFSLAAPTGNRLSWTEASTKATGFVIDRSTSSTFSSVQATFYAPRGATSYYDTSAVAGVAYYYRIRAVNAGGNSTFAYIKPKLPTVGSITGTLFNDLDASGKQNGAEAGLAGWKVYIDVHNTGKFATGDPYVLTDSKGAFNFANLAPGTYHVREMINTGWRSTLSGGSSAFTVTVAAGKASTIAFANSTTALLSGVVYYDHNANNKLDTGDVNQAGWTVFLDTNNNGKLDKGEISTVTGSQGQYSFNAAAGTYHVRAIAKTGHKLTAPSTGVYLLTLKSGDLKPGVNFGER